MKISRKTVFGLVYFILVVIGLFIYSPYVNDGKTPLTNLSNVVYVLSAVLGVTIASKVIQNTITTKLKAPPYVSLLDSLEKILISSGGFAYTIGACALLTATFYFGVTSFNEWFYGYTALMIAYDGINVAMKKKK